MARALCSLSQADTNRAWPLVAGFIGNAIGAVLDYPCHATAEQTGDFIDGLAAVFDCVMQERRDGLILVAAMLDHER
jgi:hypothetical protein